MGLDVYVETDNMSEFICLISSLNTEFSYCLDTNLRSCEIKSWGDVLEYVTNIHYDVLYYDYWLVCERVNGYTLKSWSDMAWEKYQAFETTDDKTFDKSDVHKMCLFLDTCVKCNATLYFL